MHFKTIKTALAAPLTLIFIFIFISVAMPLKADPVFNTVTTPPMMLAKAEAGSGSGQSESQACENAKNTAAVYCNSKVASFGNCNCSTEKRPDNPDGVEWICQADAVCEEPTGTK